MMKNLFKMVTICMTKDDPYVNVKKMLLVLLNVYWFNLQKLKILLS